MHVRLVFVVACLLPTLASAQAPVPTDKPVQQLSGPSNTLTVSPITVTFEQRVTDDLRIADLKWELTVNDAPRELSASCVLRAGFTDLYDCTAPLGVIPENAAIRVRAYRIIQPPPAPGELRIIR